MKRIVTAVIMLLATTNAWPAAAQQAPAQIVDEATSKVIAALEVIKNIKDKDQPELHKRKREEIRSTLLGATNMTVIAKLTLAQHSKKFSPEQMARFEDLFSRLLFSTYISHLEKYTNEKIVRTNVRNLSDRRAVVQTKMLSRSGETPIDYNFLREGDVWKMYDVKVEGVSLVNNYRTQFNDLLNQNSVDEFLDIVQEKVKENEANN